jgi:hypothetical protein
VHGNGSESTIASSSKRELIQERAQPRDISPRRESSSKRELIWKLIQQSELTQERAHPGESSPRRELT